MILTARDYLINYCQAIEKTPEWLCKKSKLEDRTIYRQYFSYIGIMHFKFKVVQLAEALGFDHSSVVIHRQKVEGFLQMEDAIAVQHINTLMAYFSSYTIQKLTYTAEEYERLCYAHYQLKYKRSIRSNEVDQLEKRIANLETKLQSLTR